MDNPKVIIRANGRVTVNGIETPFYVACDPFPGSSRRYWYIFRNRWSFKSAALFRTRGKLRQAIATFIEGATRLPDEIDVDMINRAILLCAETGSTHRIELGVRPCAN